MDFRAIITAQLDTSQAQNTLNQFISQAQGTPIQIPVNLGQWTQQGQQAGSLFANSFNSSFNNSAITGNNNRIYLQNIQRQQRQVANALNTTKINTFDNQMTAWARSNTRAMNAVMQSTGNTYSQQLANYHNQIRQLQEDISNGGGVITAAHHAQFNGIKDSFRELQSEARATGNVGKSLGDQFTSALGGIAKFAASYVGIRQVFNTIRDGIKTVNELDDALVDLQKTTTATPQQLTAFYNEANDIAKQYGTTTKQIIQGAAD